jgi:hypothetical protein
MKTTDRSGDTGASSRNSAHIRRAGSAGSTPADVGQEVKVPGSTMGNAPRANGGELVLARNKPYCLDEPDDPGAERHSRAVVSWPSPGSYAYERRSRPRTPAGNSAP